MRGIAILSMLLAVLGSQDEAYEGFMPEEWSGASLKVVEDHPTIFERVSRKLSVFAGFSMGNGFVTMTGFSDRDCVSPVWESGINIGSCLLASDQVTGAPLGSFRLEARSYKGGFLITQTKYASQDCSGDNTVTTSAFPFRQTCSPFGGSVDGIGPMRSGMADFNPDLTPKVMKGNFVSNARVALEFNTLDDCNHANFDGGDFLRQLSRYVVQKTVPYVGCYPSANGQSYRTVCPASNNGPSSPFNVYFADAECSVPLEASQSRRLGGGPQCVDSHAQSPPPQMYGGARFHKSKAFGKQSSNAHMELCFTRDGSSNNNNGSGNNLMLFPWSNYATFTPPQNDDHDNSQCQGNECPVQSCSGVDCGCDFGKGACYLFDGGVCSGSTCACGAFNDGSSCTCGSGNGNCHGDAVVCAGTGCKCIGPDCLATGTNNTVTADQNLANLRCDGFGNCQCFGSSCECKGDLCVCTGTDCGCTNPTGCTPNAHYTSCFGDSCTATGPAAAIFGVHSNCQSANCTCFGEGCNCHGNNCKFTTIGNNNNNNNNGGNNNGGCNGNCTR